MSRLHHSSVLRFQHVLPVVARNKLGTLNWKCFAGTKLSASRKLLPEKRSDGMLCSHVSSISAPCKCCYHVFWQTPLVCTVFGVSIIFSASALTLGWPTGAGADLT